MLNMIHIFVSTFYVMCIHAYQENYCKVCSNHTLCKYEISGPSSICLGYSYHALLTENNIRALVDYINFRRNYIALGLSSFFPGAANMNKITWSRDLAKSAQRWADQCDQAIQPDKEDQCRDLENIQVGQSIASIIGPSPGFNLKSFVEIWFMQSLNYEGSVTYYNQSQGHKSNQFTQLIWANTDKIGCGKVKFNVINAKNTIVERLVCNYAPRGNIHGKPVYIIGYPATQCMDDRQSDNTFTGLCSQRLKKTDIFLNKKTFAVLDKIISHTPLTTSLLRIRNLFNNYSEEEIDPVYNNLKLLKNDLKKGYLQKSTKAYPLNEQTDLIDSVKRSHPFERIWINHRNNSESYFHDGFNQKYKGHLRVEDDVKEHDQGYQLDSMHPQVFFKNPRRYDKTTTFTNYHKKQDYRNRNIDQMCTRNMGSKFFKQSTDCISCTQNKFKCTRVEKDYQNVQEICRNPKFEMTVQTNPHDFCRCNNLLTTCPDINKCIQHTNCECISNCPIKHCHNILRTLKTVTDSKKQRNEFHYYDLFSNNNSKKYSRTLSTIEEKNILLSHNNFRRLEREQHNPNHSYLKRSITEDVLNFKPFWQIDGYSTKTLPQLKSLRYTTLINKKKQKTKRTKVSTQPDLKTEHITLKLKNKPTGNSISITEKYLSFDELMLRKFNTGNYSGRRFHENVSDNNERKKNLRDSDTPKSTENTLEYTANTPFIRMKHCTRKLTCTWTAASLTDSAGSIIPGGAGGAAGHMGSRTPPGYVEGCTRTSTCTRDYMNRNKMATLQIETTTPEPDTSDDDDYCERRSLNRRNSDEVNKNNTFSHNNTLETFRDCIRYINNIRNKRNDLRKIKKQEKLLNYRKIKRENMNLQIKNDENVLSYGDLYYYVLKKILNTSNNANVLCSNSECICNNTYKFNYYSLLIFMSIFISVQ